MDNFNWFERLWLLYSHSLPVAIIFSLQIIFPFEFDVRCLCLFVCECIYVVYVSSDCQQLRSDEFPPNSLPTFISDGNSIARNYISEIMVGKVEKKKKTSSLKLGCKPTPPYWRQPNGSFAGEISRSRIFCLHWNNSLHLPTAMECNFMENHFKQQEIHFLFWFAPSFVRPPPFCLHPPNV